MGKRKIQQVSKQKKEPFKLKLTNRGKVKTKGNAQSKFSNNRLTILPKFLNERIKSQVLSGKKFKRENEDEIHEGNSFTFLNDCNSSSRNLRRSTRLSQKRTKTLAPFFLEPNKNNELSNRGKFDEIVCADRNKLTEIKGHKTKSLFRKILASQSSPKNSSSFKPSKNDEISSKFNEGLSKKVTLQLKVDVLGNIRDKINDEIDKINNILSGNSTPFEDDSKRPDDLNSDLEYEPPERVFAMDQWKYFTPYSQKLNTTFYDEFTLKPAVLCKDEDESKLYELNNYSLNTSFLETSNVEIDEVVESDRNIKSCFKSLFNEIEENHPFNYMQTSSKKFLDEDVRSRKNKNSLPFFNDQLVNTDIKKMNLFESPESPDFGLSFRNSMTESVDNRSFYNTFEKCIKKFPSNLFSNNT